MNLPGVYKPVHIWSQTVKGAVEFMTLLFSLYNLPGLNWKAARPVYHIPHNVTTGIKSYPTTSDIQFMDLFFCKKTNVWRVQNVRQES